MNNEKQLYLVPYAKKKEKIKKTFNTIGNSNGIPYSEFRVIQGIKMDDNTFQITRDDDNRSPSKKKDISETRSIRRSNYTNVNNYIDENS